MRRYILTAVTLAAALAAAHARAEDTMVATLLPPPVEASAAPDIVANEAAQNNSAVVAVPVLRHPVQKGDIITADNLTTQTIPATQVFASTFTQPDQLIGQQAVRPLMSGQPLNRLHLRIAPAISRNQTVTLVYRRGGVELSGSATALEDGQLGQSIRVVNPSTRSTIVGTVAQGGVVEMTN